MRQGQAGETQSGLSTATNPKGQRKPAESGPRAIARVLQLFGVLARSHRAMTLTALSAALGAPKSTLLGSLRGLVADDFLINTGNDYRLGPSAYRLASSIMASWSITDIVRHHLHDLAAITKESVGFAIADWEIGQVIYADAVASLRPIHYALTKSTRTTVESITENLAQIRNQGYCASFGEMLEDTAAIAVPIFDLSRTLGGALMVAAPIERMRANYPQLLAQIVATGKKISAPDGDDAGVMP